MLPMEVVVPSLRVSKQNDLNPQEHSEAMMMELEALDGKRLQALDRKRRWLEPTTRGSEESVLEKGNSFKRWYCPSALKKEN